jgi:isoleucyl-tRNA synthetase
MVTNSIHLQNFPNVEDIKIDADLVRDMDKVREICNAALAIRNDKNIRIRQPLSSLTVVVGNSEKLQNYADIIKDELNVKKVVFESDVESHASYKLKMNFPLLGKRLPAKMKQIIPASKKGEWKKVEDGRIEILGEVLTSDECSLLLEPKNKEGANALHSNDAIVILDLNITDDLQIEGIARDLVRLIQQARKDADLNVSDYIDLKINTNNDNVKKAVKIFAVSNDYSIKEQTLAKNLSVDNTADCTFTSKQKIGDDDVEIGFTVAA